jgi:hypothetical protein
MHQRQPAVFSQVKKPAHCSVGSFAGTSSVTMPAGNLRFAPIGAHSLMMSIWRGVSLNRAATPIDIVCARSRGITPL